MALGTDSQAVIDLFEEARAVELDQRLRSGERGVHSAADLIEWRQPMAIAASVGRCRHDRDGNAGRPRDRVARIGPHCRDADGLGVEAAVFTATAGDVPT